VVFADPSRQTYDYQEIFVGKPQPSGAMPLALDMRKASRLKALLQIACNRRRPVPDSAVPRHNPAHAR
jgi:hypothetical protein